MVVTAYGRTWQKINDFQFSDNDWIVGFFGDTELVMNNVDGYIVALEYDGTILKSDI